MGTLQQLAFFAAAGTSGTSASAGPTSTPPDSLGLMSRALLFTTSVLRDYGVILLVGSLFETARGWLHRLWYWLANSFFVTAVLTENDDSFFWIMHWLSQQPSWKRARNVEISTSNLLNLNAVQLDSSDDHGAHPRKATYLPAVLESYSFWYNYRRVTVTRTVESGHGGWYSRELLTIEIMTRDHKVLTDILNVAKKGYIEARKDKISIFVSDRYNNTFTWRALATRPKRPLNSIILDPGAVDLVVEDVRDFLCSKEWYAERGIPFRRGYLLYGTPGSGKTSLIHSIAGEFNLNVFVLSLVRSGLDDTGLSDLISALPERCIALLEDIDAAFYHGLSRETPHAPSAGTSYNSEQQYDTYQTAPPPSTDNRVTLSGLLNALDGIAAQEGRVLFATTNKYESLDPALCRPGRMDLHIEFKFASQTQAEELFKQFYAPSSSSSARATEEKGNSAMASEKEVDGRVNVGEDGLGSKELTSLSEPPQILPTPTPSSPPSSPLSAPLLLSEKSEDSDPAGPSCVGVSHRARAPPLSPDRVNILAAQFALAVPERRLSMASLQCFLMLHKMRPLNAVRGIGAWVEKELAEWKVAEAVKEEVGVEVETKVDEVRD